MAAPTAKPPEDRPGLVVGMTDSGIKTVRKMLDDMKAQIQMALPKHMTADRMIRVALTSVQKNEKLLQCHPVTLIGAIVQLAQLGLEPDDGTGKAYLIPFWNGKKNRLEVQAMAGYRGLVQLARNSGEVRDVIPHEVYSKDTFTYQFGTEQILTHIPYDGAGDRGTITHVYAIATYKDNGKPSFDVMTMAQVEEIHKKVIEKNKGKDSQVWIDHYDEMAKKTVVRRLCKHLPSSPELQKAVSLDEKADFAIPQDLGKLILPDEASSEAIDTPPAPKRLSDKATVKVITEADRAHIVSILDENGISASALDQYLDATFGYKGIPNIAAADFATVCKWITDGEIPFGTK